MLDAHKKRGGDWAEDAKRFMALMGERHIEEIIPRDFIEGTCLLCSEDTPERCHRRMVVEYLNGKWGDLDVEHL